MLFNSIIFENILEWLWADYLLYDHFKQKFSGIVQKYGRKRLDLEKEILRKEAHLEEIRCRAKQWKGDTCKFYKMHEVTFLDIFRKKQMLQRIEMLERQQAEKKAQLESLRQTKIGFMN